MSETFEVVVLIWISFLVTYAAVKDWKQSAKIQKAQKEAETRAAFDEAYAAQAEAVQRLHSLMYNEDHLQQWDSRPFNPAEQPPVFTPEEQAYVRSLDEQLNYDERVYAELDDAFNGTPEPAELAPEAEDAPRGNFNEDKPG